jgi:hypothetical protein
LQALMYRAPGPGQSTDLTSIAARREATRV